MKRACALPLALAITRCGLGDDVQATGDDNSLVAEISSEVIFAGRSGGTSWFHPRACRIPTPDGSVTIGMTLQSITGSDVFGQVHWSQSSTAGNDWSRPVPIEGLGRRSIDQGYEEGVCDVVPEFHAATGTVLAIGHNVYYQNQVLARPQRRRLPVYIVRSPAGEWSQPARLEWNDNRAAFIYTCGCAQRLELPDGDVLIPLSFGATSDHARAVTTVRSSFDGKALAVRDVGTTLTNSVKRGLLEPSLTRLDGRYYLTIRAEDERGYLAASDDGLKWSAPQAWAWDDGEPLTMSTTQQRWLTHRDGLFLVYTRRDTSNEKVSRWRAPLYLAEVDRKRLCLRRDTEQVLFPLSGDAIGAPQHVARMGNFHTVNATPDESWVTVGEARPADGWHGDTLLARVRWRNPNRLHETPA